MIKHFLSHVKWREARSRTIVKSLSKMLMRMQLFVAVWLLLLCSVSLGQDNCRPQDGKQGEPGVPGRDGWEGQKGEKGKSASQVELTKEALAALKGEVGEPGPVGEIGVVGYDGVIGPPGFPGLPGPTGVSGGGFEFSNRRKSAFSVIRTKKEYPRYNNVVNFDEEITKVNVDFNVGTGKFTCKIPGVYYFVFHSASEGHLCLKLINDQKPDLSLTFCDFNQNKDQVLSGGAVYELKEKEMVWIEPFKAIPNSDTNKMSRKHEMSLVFSGFLISPSV